MLLQIFHLFKDQTLLCLPSLDFVFEIFGACLQLENVLLELVNLVLARFQLLLLHQGLLLMFVLVILNISLEGLLLA